MISGFPFHSVIGLPFQMVVFHLVYGISEWHFLQLTCSPHHQEGKSTQSGQVTKHRNLTQSPQAWQLRETFACRQFRKSSGTLRCWNENTICMWIICRKRKRDHLLYFFNYLLRLNFELVVRWTTIKPMIKLLKCSGIIITSVLITISTTGIF